MKKNLILTFLTGILSHQLSAQQQFTITSSRANNYCNYACTLLDIPELNGNPGAIIFVTPVEVNGINLNPHPICVYYINNKWSVMNLDGASIQPGAQFNVEYYLNPDNNHFTHVVTRYNLVKKNSYFDHAGLNNNPNAQFRLFQNFAPSIRGGNSNRYDIQMKYDSLAGKWYMTNTNDRALENSTAYNIIISSGGSLATTPGKNESALDSARLMVVAPVNVIKPPVRPTRTPKLYGFVDMHTHPVAQLGFGEQLFFGDNDGNPNIALGSCNCIHNFLAPPFAGNCIQQNLYRVQMVNKIDKENDIDPPHLKINGFPNFDQWPKYNSLLHQQMWIDWIKRAKDSGLRVMVALAVNNQTIADAAETGGVNDDLASMNKQLARMKELFSRHTDFLEIAYTAADLRRIVTAGKLAVILGIEMDNIGNFYDPADKKGVFFNPNPTEVDIKYEIDRLFTLGVRYIFPIHITNNVFGGTALYSSVFNVANKYNTGNTFVPEVVSSAGGIDFKLQSPFSAIRQGFIGGLFMGVTGSILPPTIMPDVPGNYPTYIPLPLPGQGNRNSLGLTPKGEMAIHYMMQKGMIIDIDHMSEKSIDAVLNMATSFNYPVNSGHNGFRGITGVSKATNENGRTDQQIQRIYDLGGMMGIGHGGHSTNFVNCYRYGLSVSGGLPFAIGTDVNGFFPLPAPPLDPFKGIMNTAEMITYGPKLIKCITGAKTWDFNADGMAHYGLFPDFIESCRKVGMTITEQDAFFSSAERFAQMWEKCNTSKINIH